MKNQMKVIHSELRNGAQEEMCWPDMKVISTSVKLKL